MVFDRYKVAFFSMEIGINKDIPTYSGGLGILAGDVLRSSADMQLPIIGITLLYKEGYFRQKIDESGNQIEENEKWNPAELLEKLDKKVTIKIGREEVKVTSWAYKIKPAGKKENHIIFLDTDLEENPQHLRNITKRLYQGDRIMQEIVLGIAGVKMLKELGCNIEKYHMNEGHSSFLTLALYQENKTKKDIDELRGKCVFTTHTPVSAGHDKFDKKAIMEKVCEYLPNEQEIQVFDGNELNMTRLGLKFSGYINGVARKHKKVAQNMFPGYDIAHITNGAHAEFWAAEPFKNIFDKYLPNWRDDPLSLRSAINISKEEIWKAHAESKKRLIEEINKKTKDAFDEQVLTIGFARRFVEYKRSDLIISDVARLIKLAQEKGPIQIIFAGKAHPNDSNGKEIIKRTYQKIKNINDEKKPVKIIFLENYNIELAKLLVSGCDIWLNNPRRNYEASGTSGMKAAINGVPHLSTLDGWWIEGHIENITGWSIGIHPKESEFDEDIDGYDEADDLYKKLDETIIPLFYKDKDKWASIMRNCIAINASFFNTHRVMQQYVTQAYFR